MSLTTRLDLLRTILEKKKSKEEIDDNELAAAGLTSKSRIKDIEKEIKLVRTKVSSSIKTSAKEVVENELREEAESLNMTVDDLKEKLAAEAHNERKKNLLKGIDTELNDALKAAVAKERKKKDQAREGDFDYE